MCEALPKPQSQGDSLLFPKPKRGQAPLAPKAGGQSPFSKAKKGTVPGVLAEPLGQELGAGEHPEFLISEIKGTEN